MSRFLRHDPRQAYAVAMTDPYEGQKNPVLAFLQKRWLGAIIVLLAAIFIIQNSLVTGYTTVYLFAWTLHMPNWLLIAVVFFAGWAVGWSLARRNKSAKK